MKNLLLLVLITALLLQGCGSDMGATMDDITKEDTSNIITNTGDSKELDEESSKVEGETTLTEEEVDSNLDNDEKDGESTVDGDEKDDNDDDDFVTLLEFVDELILDDPSFAQDNQVIWTSDFTTCSYISGYDETLNIWHDTDESPIVLDQVDGTYRLINFSPNGQYLITEDGTSSVVAISIYDVYETSFLNYFITISETLLWSDDSSMLASTTLSDTSSYLAIEVDTTSEAILWHADTNTVETIYPSSHSSNAVPTRWTDEGLEVSINNAYLSTTDTLLIDYLSLENYKYPVVESLDSLNFYDKMTYILIEEGIALYGDLAWNSDYTKVGFINGLDKSIISIGPDENTWQYLGSGDEHTFFESFSPNGKYYVIDSGTDVVRSKEIIEFEDRNTILTLDLIMDDIKWSADSTMFATTVENDVVLSLDIGNGLSNDLIVWYEDVDSIFVVEQGDANTMIGVNGFDETSLFYTLYSLGESEDLPGFISLLDLADTSKYDLYIPSN